jgi:excisionase family DNA binding protein
MTATAEDGDTPYFLTELRVAECRRLGCGRTHRPAFTPPGCNDAYPPSSWLGRVRFPGLLRLGPLPPFDLPYWAAEHLLLDKWPARAFCPSCARPLGPNHRCSASILIPRDAGELVRSPFVMLSPAGDSIAPATRDIAPIGGEARRCRIPGCEKPAEQAYADISADCRKWLQLHPGATDADRADNIANRAAHVSRDLSPGSDWSDDQIRGELKKGLGETWKPLPGETFEATIRRTQTVHLRSGPDLGNTDAASLRYSRTETLGGTMPVSLASKQFEEGYAADTLRREREPAAVPDRGTSAQRAESHRDEVDLDEHGGSVPGGRVIVDNYVAKGLAGDIGQGSKHRPRLSVEGWDSKYGSKTDQELVGTPYARVHPRWAKRWMLGVRPVWPKRSIPLSDEGKLRNPGKSALDFEITMKREEMEEWDAKAGRPQILPAPIPATASQAVKPLRPRVVLLQRGRGRVVQRINGQGEIQPLFLQVLQRNNGKAHMTSEITTWKLTGPALYGSADAAEVLGVDEDLVGELVNTGELGTVMIGSRQLIPATAIASYLERLG